MLTTDLIKEIQRLPLPKRYFIVEEIMRSIKEEKLQNQMELAAEELYDDYVGNKELIAFTSLDIENFYEPK